MDKQINLIAKVLSILICATGILVIIGWLLDISILNGIVSGMTSMKANTAFGFLIGGFTLWLFHTKKETILKKMVAIGFSLTITLIGLLTMGEYLLGVNLGIDEFVVRDNIGAIATPNPGRMDSSTAFCFILSGISLILLYKNKAFQLFQLFNLLILGISLFIFVGYIYKVSDLQGGVVNSTRISIYSSLMFIVLSIGMLFSKPDRGIMVLLTNNGVAGIALRRLLPVIIFLPIALGWLRLMGERVGYYDLEFGLSLFAFTNILILIAVVVAVSRNLLSIDKEREDVTKELKKSEEQLQSINKELESFSYSVSHDLRAPLRAINGFANIIHEDYNHVLDEEGRRLLGVIQFNAKNMGNLIDDLLAFSRLGRKDIQKTNVDMHKLAEGALLEASKLFENKAEVRINKLSSAFADYALINQVFINLISNAIKYSSKNTHPLIEIKSEQQNGDVIYSIKDNGVGFDMQYAHKLFNVFQRLHTTDDFEGTGVGLAIVQRIINKHGGKVWAEAALEKGATFYFSLPLNH